MTDAARYFREAAAAARRDEEAQARLNAALRRTTTVSPEDVQRLGDTITRAFDAIREAFRPFVEAVLAAGRKMVALIEGMRERANDPVYVAGLEGRFLVRAGLDPAYRHPERRDALIRDLLSGEAEDAGLLFLLDPENRHRVALAAIRGWVHSYGDREPGEQPYVAHRLWGTDRVEVSCG